MIRKIKYWFKKKYRQIERVIDFIPLIWKGYDWDYHYAIEIFQHQLKRMAKHIDSDEAWALRHKQTASRIYTAVELMDKVYNEEYGMEYFDILDKKYGRSSFDFVELDEKDDKGEPYYTLEVNNELARDKKHQEEIDKERIELMKVSQAKQKRAHRVLWEYIEHNIQHWWD